jgi:hypothetical protein
VPSLDVAGGEYVDVAIHNEAGTGGGTGEGTDNVGHVRLWGDHLGRDTMGAKVGDQDICCETSVSWRVW